MRHVAGPRNEIAQKSIFNILGPLTNPASAKCQVMGVYDKKWMIPLATTIPLRAAIISLPTCLALIVFPFTNPMV